MTPAERDERRCPSCGALASPDAEWCGQCFASLVEPEPESATGSAPKATPDPRPEATVGERAEPYWPCPACETRNPIEADACTRCGTPFAALMRAEPDRPSISPKDAVAWSLLYPGLGHRKVGRSTDGFARGVLFGISFGMALVLGLAGGGVGALMGSFALFLAAALAVYVLSAVEAARLAEGGQLLVSSRALMWVLVGVIFLSVGMLGLTVVTATRR